MEKILSGDKDLKNEYQKVASRNYLNVLRKNCRLLSIQNIVEIVVIVVD